MPIPHFVLRSFTTSLALLVAGGSSLRAQAVPPYPSAELVQAASAHGLWHTAIFFAAITGIVFIVVWGRVRRSRLQHETVRLLAEKGVPIPPELFQPPVRRNDLRKGMVWIALGLGIVVVGLAGQSHGSHGVWALGVIPLLIGSAFLIAWTVEKRDKTQP